MQISREKLMFSSLDPLSGLRTNQIFSSFKLKNHTKSAKSMDFGQKSVVFADSDLKSAQNPSKSTDFVVFGWNLHGFTDLQSWGLELPSSKVFQMKDQQSFVTSIVLKHYFQKGSSLKNCISTLYWVALYCILLCAMLFKHCFEDCVPNVDLYLGHCE